MGNVPAETTRSGIGGSKGQQHENKKKILRDVIQLLVQKELTSDHG